MPKKKAQIITIQIYPRKSQGITNYSMRFVHGNGKIANDKYTRRNTAVKMAKHFAGAIQKGNYRIKAL